MSSLLSYFLPPSFPLPFFPLLSLPCFFPSSLSLFLPSYLPSFPFSFAPSLASALSSFPIDPIVSHSPGKLSARELRTLAAKIYPLPLDSATMKKLEKTLINCSLDINKTPQGLNEKTSASAVPVVTESLLSACAPILTLLNDTKKSSKKYKHETLGDDDIAFKMIGNNATAVLRQLDNIRANKKKFICLNDNIDHSQDATTVRALLVDFYESFFPIPSQFELLADYRNQFLYVDELREWKKERQEIDSRTRTLIAVLAFVLLVILFRRKLYGFVRYLNPFRMRLIPSVSNSGSTRLLSVWYDWQQACAPFMGCATRSRSLNHGEL